MPKSKKQPKDMTTEELAKKVFPLKLRKKLKEIMKEKDDKSGSIQSSQV